MTSTLKQLAAGVAAIAMTATPVAAAARPTAPAASANPAAALSVGATRTGSTPANVSNVRGSRSTLINLAIFAVIVGGILLATTTGGDDEDSDSN